jgi:hypothetical protein
MMESIGKITWRLVPIAIGIDVGMSGGKISDYRLALIIFVICSTVSAEVSCESGNESTF